MSPVQTKLLNTEQSKYLSPQNQGSIKVFGQTIINENNNTEFKVKAPFSKTLRTSTNKMGGAMKSQRSNKFYELIIDETVSTVSDEKVNNVQEQSYQVANFKGTK